MLRSTPVTKGAAEGTKMKQKASAVFLSPFIFPLHFPQRYVTLIL